MNLSDEDKAVLVAAAKILIREPREVMFGFQDEEDDCSVTNEDVATELCQLTDLPEFYKLLPVRYVLARK